ncbi:MAG: TolC family protein [Ginsengibacter sp.]
MKTFLLNFLFLSIAFTTVSQDRMTLQDAVKLGIKNNLDVNQAGLQMQNAEIDYKQSRAFMLPDLNASASQGINQGRSIDPFTNSFINQKVGYASYGANSSLLLFRGSSLQNQIKENKLGYEASKLERQDAIDRITINIILSYLQIVSAEDVLKQIQEQVLVTDKQIERLEILNKEGAIAPALLYDLKGQSANEQISIADQKSTISNAKLNLLQILNIPYNKNFEVAGISPENISSPYPQIPEEIYQAALNNFARVKAAKLRTESSEKSIKSARGELFPSLYLGGNLNTNYSSVASRSFLLNTSEVASTDYVMVGGDKIFVNTQNNNFRTDKINFGDQLSNNLFSSVNLTLNIPLFNAGQTRNKIKRAKITYENYRLVEQHTQTELQQAIERSYVEVENSFAKYQLLENQVIAFTESFRAAEIRFNTGLITSVDYLITKNNLDRSNTNLIISRYDFILRSKVLDYYQGKALW